MVLTRFRRSRSGQAIVIMALAMVAICGMLALAIDAGRLYFQRRLMQDAVDAGALAGAQDLVATNAYPNGQPNWALYHAQQDSFSVFNLPAIGVATDPQYAQPSVTQTQGGYTVTTVAPTGYDNKQVQVTVGFNATGTFAQILGFNQINIQATATAEAGTNPKTYAIFAYTKGGSGNTIWNDQNGYGQVDDGQDGADVCNTSSSGLTLSNAKFHVPNPTLAALNINGHLTVYSASDNNGLFSYWQSPVSFGGSQDPEPDYIQPDVSQIALARSPSHQSNVPAGGTWTPPMPAGWPSITLSNHTSATRDIWLYYPGKYTNSISIGNGSTDAINGLYVFLNGLYYMRANFTSNGGFVSNTTDGLPHYSATTPSVGITDLPAAVDGTNGVEFIFDGGAAFAANNTSLPNDGSMFFVAPSYTLTGSTHIAFYISSTNANTGTVWNESFNATASLTPKFQIWGTVFDADGSGSMNLTGVELGPHDRQPETDGAGAQYAINGEFIGAYLNLYDGNVLGNTAGTPAGPCMSTIGPGKPSLLVQYNSLFAPAPGVNSYLLK